MHNRNWFNLSLFPDCVLLILTKGINIFGFPNKRILVKYYLGQHRGKSSLSAYWCPHCWGIDLPYGLHIRTTGHNQPRGSRVDWWVLTTANAAGTNGLTCLQKHGGASDNKFNVVVNWYSYLICWNPIKIGFCIIIIIIIIISPLLFTAGHKFLQISRHFARKKISHDLCINLG
jgi:hypothetical protein